MATVYVYGASIDENGKAHGGKAGNQTGRELRKQAWYKHAKGWRVFRAKNPSVATKIAQCAKAAVANRHIGYDQYQRNTLYNEAVKYDFDVSKVTKDVETDCSALVRVCCAFAGVTGLPAEFRTTNEPALLLKTGAFTELAGDQYTKQSACLRAGDILCTKTQGHTVVVGNDGAKAEAQTPADLPEPQGLSRGDHGSAVETMQRLLLKWDAACLPKCGADGDFGSETELAVRDFQACHEELAVTGKIYVATDTNKTYRWTGSAYVEISASLALGETSSTAYRGDRGKVAYDHAQAHGSAFASGLYKITTNAEGHVTGAVAPSVSDLPSEVLVDVSTVFNSLTGWHRVLTYADGTTYTESGQIVGTMQGASSSNYGHPGIVPRPIAGDESKFLRGDGTWAVPSGGGADVGFYIDAQGYLCQRIRSDT